MKKYGIFFMVLFLASCSVMKSEERFVNPVFYSLMEEGHKEDIIKITPTEYRIKSYDGRTARADCEMLENTMEKVTLKCLFMPADPNNEKEYPLVFPDDDPTYRTRSYVIDNDNPFHVMGIIEYVFFENETKWGQRTPYFIVNAPSAPWSANESFDED